jgi:hypothetical protein
MVATMKYYVDQKAKEIQSDLGQKLEDINSAILEQLGQLKERVRLLESVNLRTPNSDIEDTESPVQLKVEEAVPDPKAGLVLERSSENTSGGCASAEVSETLSTKSPKANKGPKLKIRFKVKEDMDIRTCRHCLGSFSRKSVRRHERKCREKSKAGRFTSSEK